MIRGATYKSHFQIQMEVIRFSQKYAAMFHLKSHDKTLYTLTHTQENQTGD